MEKESDPDEMSQYSNEEILGSPYSQDMQQENDFSQSSVQSFSGQGCHEDFDVVYPEENSSDEQNEDEDIEKLRERIKHLEVHCYVYQQAILKTPNGVHIWHETAAKEFASSTDPICQECVQSKLLHRIAELEKQLKTSN